MSSSSSWVRVARRVATTLAIVCASLEVLYVVAVNVFLSTSLFDHVVDASPESVDIHFERGWSIFPTRVYARKLSIRGTDSHIEWMLRLDKVDFECSLLALVRREFHVTSVNGEGISFRMRFKVASPAAVSELTQFLPPISSLGPVGLIPDEPPDPGTWDDRKWHLWTVRIEHANAERVREIWIEDDRFTGDAHITGGFFLKPIRSVEVGPLSIESDDGMVAIKSHIGAEHIHASVGMTVSRFDPRVTEGSDVLHSVSLSATGSLAVPDVGNVGLAPPHGITLAGAASVSRFGVRVAKGVLQDGSYASAGGNDIVLTAGEQRVSIDAIAIDAGIEAHRFSGRVKLENIESTLSAHTPLATIEADSKGVDLVQPFGDLHAIITVPEAELREARLLSGVLPRSAPVRVIDGTVRGALEGELWRQESRLRASASLRASNVRALAGTTEVSGDVALHAALKSLRWDTLQATGADLSVLVERGVVGTHGDPWVRATGLHADANAADADLTHPWRAFEANVEGDDVEVLESSALQAALKLGKDVHLGSGRVRLRTSAHIVMQAGEARGALSASSKGLRVTSPHLRVAGDIEANLAVASKDGKTLAGTVSLASTRIQGTFVSHALAPDFVVDGFSLHAASRGFDVTHPSLAGVDYRVALGGAELVDARALNVFLPTTQIMAIESGRARVALDIASGATGARGHLGLRLVHGGVVLGETHFAGDIAVTMQARRDGEDRTVLDVGGTKVALNDVEVRGASTDTARWSGDLTIESGRLDVGSEPRLDADLVLRARDANPILAILFRDTLSRTVAGLTHMPSLTAVTHLSIDTRQMLVSGLVAKGGDISLRGAYALRSKQAGGSTGAFVLHKGPLSFGMDVDSRGPHLRLFGLDKWYRGRAAEVTLAR